MPEAPRRTLESRLHLSSDRRIEVVAAISAATAAWLSARGGPKLVLQVPGGFSEIHGRDLVARGNSLVQSGKDPEAQLARQRGLADEQQGQW
jgi:hypothetical protein